MRKVKIEQVHLSGILFSLPTIANDLPPVLEGSSKVGKTLVEILEDDWRQIEWVHTSAIEAVEAEFASIRDIYEHERKGVGFKRVHVRELIPQPLAGADLRLQDFWQALGLKATCLEGVSFHGVAGVVSNSFAVRLMSSIELYGLNVNGVVETVCFANTRTNNVPQPDVRNLAHFAAAHDLILIDWCSERRLTPTEEEYRSYFVEPAS